MIAVRNLRFALRHPARTWHVGKLCEQYTQANPKCAWCGREGQAQAHHILPIWARPDLAECKDNLISLCGKRGCHRLLGHDGDFARRYVANVRLVCATKQNVVRSL